MLLLSLAAVLMIGTGLREIYTNFGVKEAHAQGSSSEYAKSPKDVMLDRKFSVSPGERLQVQVSHSDVTITTGSAREAHVQVLAGGPSASKAREFFEHLNFRVEKSGGTVSITTNPRRNWRWNWGNTDIDVLITIPEVFDADVAVSHGDTQVNRLKGRLSFSTAHGDLDAGMLSGSSLEMAAAHGDLAVREIAADKLRLSVAHGDVEIGRLSAATFEATASHGDIEIKEADGRADISSSHGDIRIAFARAAGGTFTSSHGNINLSAPSLTAADLDLMASNVEIAGSYSFEGTQKRDRILGKINGGGPRLSARSTHGRISLRAN